MISLRQCATCIGLGTRFSVLRDFFGFRNKLAEIGLTYVSLKRQLGLVQTPHIHLDLIRVSDEPEDEFSRRAMDIAVQVARDIFAQVGLGIGRVTHSALSGQDGARYEFVDSQWEFRHLLKRFRGPTDDAVDVFFVTAIDYGAVGDRLGMAWLLPTACNKDLYHYDGCLVALTVDRIPLTGVGLEPSPEIGVTLAHELGHRLGLPHHSDQDNLMYHKVVNPYVTLVSPDVPVQGKLTRGQGRDLKRRCMVRDGC
jgi:hypothetical protein